MTGAGVVLLENWMMNNCGTHRGGGVSESPRVSNPDASGLPDGRACGPWISITHVRRSSVKQLLRLGRIESLQNLIFRLGTGFVFLLNVNKSQVQVRGRVIILEPDRGPQFFECRGQAMQFEISKTQFGMGLDVFRLQTHCFPELLGTLCKAAEVVVTPAEVVAHARIVRRDAN